MVGDVVRIVEGSGWWDTIVGNIVVHTEHSKKGCLIVATAIRKAIEDARRQALDEAIAEVRRSTGMSLRAIGGQIEQLKEQNDD